jgi:hypothetical protein
MLVDRLVYYLIHEEGMNWREDDYRANKVVKCVKNENFNGTFYVKIAGQKRTFNHSSRGEFLKVLWPHMAKNVITKMKIEGTVSIVPVPNSSATVASKDEYKTLKYARAIAASSGGKLTAVDALRWKTAQTPQHKGRGRRDPAVRFQNLQRIATPTTPVILFDDFLTSGASLIASFWRLEEAGATPTRAFVIGRQTHIQEPKMLEWGSEDLEIPAKPLF